MGRRYMAFKLSSFLLRSPDLRDKSVLAIHQAPQEFLLGHVKCSFQTMNASTLNEMATVTLLAQTS
jgi:hypothetical protein